VLFWWQIPYLGGGSSIRDIRALFSAEVPLLQFSFYGEVFVDWIMSGIVLLSVF
jgi:hypothetical protein